MSIPDESSIFCMHKKCDIYNVSWNLCDEHMKGFIMFILSKVKEKPDIVIDIDKLWTEYEQIHS